MTDEEIVTNLVNLAFRRGVDAGMEIAISIVNKKTDDLNLQHFIRKVTAEAMGRSNFPKFDEAELLIECARVIRQRWDGAEAWGRG